MTTTRFPTEKELRHAVTRFPIREPNRGEVVAVHVRQDGPDGKRMHWERPDGTIGLDGLRTADLPLYGAAAAHRWDVERPVLVVEGEKAASALVRAGYQAAGTVTGAAGCPGSEPLMILAGMEAVLWPDADEAGRRHMQAVAEMLGEPGDIVGHPLRWIAWGSDGADAADALEAGVDVDALVAGAGPVPPAIRAEVVPFRRETHRRPSGESEIERFNSRVPVTEVLRREFGIEARPGRAVRCPYHEDRHPSLAILPDDLRAYCHAPTCWAHNGGRGRDAWDLATAAERVAR